MNIEQDLANKIRDDISAKEIASIKQQKMVFEDEEKYKATMRNANRLDDLFFVKHVREQAIKDFSIEVIKELNEEIKASGLNDIQYEYGLGVAKTIIEKLVEVKLKRQIFCVNCDSTKIETFDENGECPKCRGEEVKK